MATLGILECDVLYDDLIADYSSYGVMLSELLASIDPHLNFTFYQVHNDELPSEGECDAYLLTGSKTGVYDDDHWVPPLMEWVRVAHARKEPMLGICFGHQLLAHALGGHAGLSNKGWGVGNHMTEIDHRPMWLNDDQPAYQLIYSHKDQVSALPEGARRLAGSDFCEYAAWYLNDLVLSFQGHPEFTPEYFRRLQERRREDVGDERLTQAMNTLEQPNDSETIARWMTEFIHLPRA